MKNTEDLTESMVIDIKLAKTVVGKMKHSEEVLTEVQRKIYVCEGRNFIANLIKQRKKYIHLPVCSGNIVIAGKQAMDSEVSWAISLSRLVTMFENIYQDREFYVNPDHEGEAEYYITGKSKVPTRK